MRRRELLSLLGGAVAAWPMAARARDYPTRLIHFLVPFAPGGVSDIAARLVGQGLTEALGQQVIVENRPGGNGFIAVMAAVKAPPDGYTFVVGTVGEFAINPSLYKSIPYDVERDLTAVAMLSDTPLVLAANSASPYRASSCCTSPTGAERLPRPALLREMSLSAFWRSRRLCPSSKPNASEFSPSLPPSARATIPNGGHCRSKACPRSTPPTGSACSRRRASRNRLWSS